MTVMYQPGKTSKLHKIKHHKSDNMEAVSKYRMTATVGGRHMCKTK